MSAIVNLEKRKWLLGMTWYAYKTAPSRDRLLTDSEEIDAPWCAIRTTDEVVQVGYGKQVDGIARPRKIASLAAFLADARPQPWMGKFDLGNGLWWYIAVRDNYAILPAGDVVGTLEEVDELWRSDSGFGGWTHEVGNLESLGAMVRDVSRKNKRTWVKSLAVTRLDPMHVAVTGALSVAILACGFAYKHHHDVEVMRARRAAYLLHHRASALPEVTARKLAGAQPAPSAWIGACARTLDSEGLSIDDWARASNRCDSSAVTITWKRQLGATVAARPPGDLMADGNEVRQVVSFRQQLAGEAGSATSRMAAVVALTAWGQKFGVKVALGAPRPIGQKAAGGWEIPVTIPLPLSPFDLGQELDAIAGLRVTTLAAAPGAANGLPSADSSQNVSSWIATGVIYADR